MSSTRQASLETLYPALLLEIVEYLSPTWIVNLWLTGSVQLRTSLSKRGVVTSLKLHGPNGAFSTSRLPGMIACFESLLHLSITSANRIAVPYRIWNCLSQLVQLKTLQLEFPEVDEWMFWNNSSESASTPSYSQPSPDKATQARLFRCLRPIATTFAHLETFKLCNKSTAGFLRNEHLSLLPKSLTSLSVLYKVNDGAFDEKCFEYVASLPKLAEMHIGSMKGLKLSTPSLPPSITSLTFERVPFASILIEPSFWIGSNIAKLNLSLHPDSVADLPPTITKLKVVGSNLSTLSFQHLPALLEVDIASEAEYNDFRMPSFNSPLESLEVAIKHSINNFDLTTICPSVKNLNVSFKHRVDFDNAFKYIQCFTKLVTLSIYSVHFEPGHFQQLPPTLTSLLWIGRGSGLNIDDEVAKLPRGLTSLIFPINPAKLSPSAFQHLPPCLKRLRISAELPTESSDEEIAKDFESLPRSLRSLIISPYVVRNHILLRQYLPLRDSLNL